MSYRTNISLDDPSWQRLHEHYLDAVRQQPRNVRDALAHDVGDSFGGFVAALADGWVRVSAEFADDGLWYVVRFPVSDGLAELLRVHSRRLGLDDAGTAAAEHFWRRRN